MGGILESARCRQQPLRFANDVAAVADFLPSDWSLFLQLCCRECLLRRRYTGTASLPPSLPPFLLHSLSLCLLFLHPYLAPPSQRKKWLLPTICFYIFPSLWGFSGGVWALTTGCCWRKWGINIYIYIYIGLKKKGRGPKAKEVRISVSASPAPRPERIMQHLQPWRALLLFTVLWQPGSSDKYGKMTLKPCPRALPHFSVSISCGPLTTISACCDLKDRRVDLH